MLSQVNLKKKDLTPLAFFFRSTGVGLYSLPAKLPVSLSHDKVVSYHRFVRVFGCTDNMTSKSISTLHVLSSSDDSEESCSEEESSNFDACGEASVQAVLQNMLFRLNMAKPASVSRTRALRLNPPGERKRCGPSTNLRRKSLHDCVAGFPGEYLVVECGTLL